MIDQYLFTYGTLAKESVQQKLSGKNDHGVMVDGDHYLDYLNVNYGHEFYPGIKIGILHSCNKQPGYIYVHCALVPLFYWKNSVDIWSDCVCVEHPRASAILHFEKGFKGFSVKNKKLFLVNPTSLDNASVRVEGAG